MKFYRILVTILVAGTLAACNFSLAEDITPPPGAELTPIATLAPTATQIPTSSAASPSNGLGSISPTPAAAGTTAPAGSVTIAGTVSNGSGGPLPAGLTANLHGILNQQEALSLSLPLNPDGSYSFTKVALTNGMEFLVAVKYGPVSFFSQGGVFDGTKSSYDQPVTIYNSTADLTSLSLNQLHIQASFSTPGAIQLDEIYVLTNPGKTAVAVSTDGTSLPFASLPVGALQPSISLSQGSAPLGMADTGFAMLPGSQQYSFVVSFSLPYTNNQVSLSQPFSLSPNSVAVIVPAGVQVAGAGLSDQGTSDYQGASYQIYSAGALQPGSALGLRFSSSPQAAATGVPSLALLIGLGSLGLVLVAGGLILFWRDRRKVQPAETVQPGTPEGTTARLADAILALDERFAAGQIDQAAYQKQRAALKEQLKSLL